MESDLNYNRYMTAQLSVLHVTVWLHMRNYEKL
jgi:hypothetical protein